MKRGQRSLGQGELIPDGSLFPSRPAQEWLVSEKNRDVFGMKLPTGFQLIGQVVRIWPPLACSSAAPAGGLLDLPVPLLLRASQTTPSGSHTTPPRSRTTPPSPSPPDPTPGTADRRSHAHPESPVLLADSRRESSKVSNVCRLTGWD